MLLLILFAFIAGIVTILSPCILPILPVVLSGSVGGGHRKPLGIVLGFVLSFSFFTLALATLVKLTGLSADLLRNFSVVIILLFGLSLLVPKFQIILEQLFNKLAKVGPKKSTDSGFIGGVILGLSLGLVWTPCVGPIIASVIALAAISSVNLATIVITLSYSLGTAIPMLLITYGGRQALLKVPWLINNTVKIQKAFGVLMILTALAIFFSLDRRFQTYILDKFPNYGTGLTKIEDNAKVLSKLQELQAVKPLPADSNSQMAPEIIAGGKWFNLPDGKTKLSLADIRGKVVLIDFWTYTCINCIRTLPYIRAWDEKYRSKGLVIIGVHTPEFEFEKDAGNVQKALGDFAIKYPVVQDNDYATWNAYNNQYWPAKYFIDKNGNIRSTHFGEGKYDESEKLIQELLAETGVDIANMPISNQDYSIDTRTPETYLGYARINNFGSLEGIVQDKASLYSAPKNLRSNNFAYSGSWTVTSERAMPEKGANLTFNFESKNVYLVMRPKGKDSGQIKVFLDDQLVDAKIAGDDVSGGEVKVADDRLYTLIKLPAPGKHLLRLEFLDNNLELYAFTFG